MGHSVQHSAVLSVCGHNLPVHVRTNTICVGPSAHKNMQIFTGAKASRILLNLNANF